MLSLEFINKSTVQVFLSLSCGTWFRCLPVLKLINRNSQTVIWPLAKSLLPRGSLQWYKLICCENVVCTMSQSFYHEKRRRAVEITQ